MENKILDKEVKRLVIYDIKNKKELAVITHKEVETANSDIEVRLSFK